MSATPRTLVVYPGPNCLGGISKVVENLEGTPFWSRWRCRGFGTYSEAPAALVRALYSLWRVALFPFALLRYRAGLVIVHTSSGGSFTRKSCYAMLAHLFRRRFILHVHPSHFWDYYQASPAWRRRWIDAVMRRAALLIFTNQGTRARFAALHGDARCAHLANPVDVDAMAGARDRTFAGNFNVLYLGWIIPEKGVFDLVDAIPGVLERFPDATFSFAGNKQVERLRARVAELGLEQSAKVLGWVGGDAKLELMRRSRLLILPSYSEGLPNVLLEAMAAGLPIVVTPVGGIPEAFTEHVNGLYVEPRNVDQITHALCTLLGDDAQCEAISRATVASVEGRFDRFSVAAALDALCTAAWTS